jgi:hypothetical protein
MFPAQCSASSFVRSLAAAQCRNRPTQHRCCLADSDNPVHPAQIYQGNKINVLALDADGEGRVAAIPKHSGPTGAFILGDAHRRAQDFKAD